MDFSIVVIGLLFMGISVYQLNKKTKMDEMIIQNYERKHTVINPDKLLKIEHTSKAMFGAWVAMTGLMEMWFMDDKTATLWILIGVVVWQILDRQMKKPFLKKK